MPKPFIAQLVGHQSSNKKKIEDSTECLLTIPDRRKHGPVGMHFHSYVFFKLYLSHPLTHFPPANAPLSKSPISVIKSTVGIENVERCLDQIEMFVLVQRERARPTHFLSLALQSDELLDNYDTFCTLLKNSPSVPVSSQVLINIKPFIFQDVCKIPELFMPRAR